MFNTESELLPKIKSSEPGKPRYRRVNPTMDNAKRLKVNQPGQVELARVTAHLDETEPSFRATSTPPALQVHLTTSPLNLSHSRIHIEASRHRALDVALVTAHDKRKTLEGW